jgi:outer membrane protein assembly factor BamD
MRLTRWIFALLAIATLQGCRPGFQPQRYTTDEELYSAALSQFERRRWDNAVAGFERLVSSLPQRDTLLPRSHWHLARSYQQRREWLLAAQSFQRLSEGFPTDSLADDAAMEAARSYRRLWRRPSLDAQYGEVALATYRQFLLAHPTSPLLPAAQSEIAELEQWFALKHLETGNFYIRRRAFDSAVLSLRQAREEFPDAPASRQAGLRLVEVYRRIRWNEEAAEVCASLRERHPDDREVAAMCPASG